MRDDVVALYVDPRGPYPSLVADWYDESRDATTYAGPLPVVAHPPCGPWGRLKHLCTRQKRVHAVHAVRTFGGVLEHPEWSGAFAACGMPRPGELPDAWGGVTVEVCQCDWGHVARKRTWLYMVGVRELGPLPPRREPTHWISGGRSRSPETNRMHTRVPEGIKICSAQQRRRTPRAFAEWLLSLAAQARRTRAA